MGNYSFGLLKPDCLKRKLEREVFAMIKSGGLRFIISKRVRLTEREVAIIWAPCVGQWFYEEMVRFSTSYDCIVFLVQGENAISRLSDLIGHYNPTIAKEGTIRKRFGTSLMENLIHSSNNEKTFKRESCLFFKGFRRLFGSRDFWSQRVLI